MTAVGVSELMLHKSHAVKITRTLIITNNSEYHDYSYKYIEV